MGPSTCYWEAGGGARCCRFWGPPSGRCFRQARAMGTGRWGAAPGALLVKNDTRCSTLCPHYAVQHGRCVYHDTDQS